MLKSGRYSAACLFTLTICSMTLAEGAGREFPVETGLIRVENSTLTLPHGQQVDLASVLSRRIIPTADTVLKSEELSQSELLSIQDQQYETHAINLSSAEMANDILDKAVNITGLSNATYLIQNKNEMILSTHRSQQYMDQPSPKILPAPPRALSLALHPSSVARHVESHESASITIQAKSTPLKPQLQINAYASAPEPRRVMAVTNTHEILPAKEMHQPVMATGLLFKPSLVDTIDADSIFTEAAQHKAGNSHAIADFFISSATAATTTKNTVPLLNPNQVKANLKLMTLATKADHMLDHNLSLRFSGIHFKTLKKPTPIELTLVAAIDGMTQLSQALKGQVTHTLYAWGDAREIDDRSNLELSLTLVAMTSLPVTASDQPVALGELVVDNLKVLALNQQVVQTLEPFKDLHFDVKNGRELDPIAASIKGAMLSENLKNQLMGAEKIPVNDYELHAYTNNLATQNMSLVVAQGGNDDAQIDFSCSQIIASDKDPTTMQCLQ